MKLFRRDDDARLPERADADVANRKESISHRLTLELKRAETFATMLAHSRSSNVIEVSDYLAGMYICNWDRLSEYWDDHDKDEIENLLRGICRISPQRWHSWIELYHRQRSNEKERFRRLFESFKQKNPADTPTEPSQVLAAVLKQAEQIAPAYDRTGNRSIPILTSECVLLSIARNLGSEIGRKLAQTGIDIGRLQKDVLLPRRPPRT